MFPVHLKGEGTYVSTWVPPINKPIYDILRKAKFTCSCCGFRSVATKEKLHGYMHVVGKGSSVKVYCTLCYSSLTIGRLLVDKNDESEEDADVELNAAPPRQSDMEEEVYANGVETGKLIYAPSLSQKNVSDIVRICAVAGAVDGIPKTIKRNALEMHRSLTKNLAVDSHIHPFFEGDEGSPLSLAALSDYISPEDLNLYINLATNLRFVPDLHIFTEACVYYYKINPDYFKF